MTTRMARIGRPGIGGEFLDVCDSAYGRYRLRRFRQVNSQNEAPRQLNVDDLPGETLVYDLVSVIERIVEHMNETTDYGFDADDHGINGARPSLRERFKALSEIDAAGPRWSKGLGCGDG